MEIINKIERFLHIVQDILLLLFRNTVLRLFLKYPKSKKKYEFAICCIFKNEAPFLKEWIEFHTMIGVEHFYMYNNNSEDNYEEVLKPYIDKGIVSLKLWNKDHAQMEAYKDFYTTKKDETQWVSFLDPDEYMCPVYRHNLHDWIKPYRKYPAILIYWKMFGTSGKMEHDNNKLLIEQYYVSWKDLYKVGKCWINTDYDITVFDAFVHHCPHLRMYIAGIPIIVRPVNQFKFFITPDIHLSLLYNEEKRSIQCNHYWSKAWNVYAKKMNMTDVYFDKNPKANINYFYWHERHNVSCDYSIMKYIIQLKHKLGYTI